jgi:hypothetical protein
MATWISVKKASKFPEVINVYARAGRGQGSTQGAGATTPKQAQRGFLVTIKRLFNESNGAALPSWLRKSPQGSNDWQDAQVDVTAIPGVRKLRANGKWVGF